MESGLGFDWSRPIRHMREYLTCLTGFLAGEAVTFDLITAFPATDSGGPTTEIRAGDQRAADSFVDGWSAPRRDADGGLVAWADAPTASISFDAGAHPLETTVTLDCVVGDLGHVPFVLPRLNGRPVGRYRLSPGTQQIRMTLRAEQLVAGRNVLNLFVPTAHPGPDAPDAAKRFGVRSLLFESGRARPPPARVEGDRLVLAPGTAVTYFLRLPGNAVLAFESGERTADRLHVTVQADQRPERAALATRSGLAHLTVDLGPEADAITRVTLSADGTELGLVRPVVPAPGRPDHLDEPGLVRPGPHLVASLGVHQTENLGMHGSSSARGIRLVSP